MEEECLIHTCCIKEARLSVNNFCSSYISQIPKAIFFQSASTELIFFFFLIYTSTRMNNEIHNNLEKKKILMIKKLILGNWFMAQLNLIIMTISFGKLPAFIRSSLKNLTFHIEVR